MKKLKITLALTYVGLAVIANWLASRYVWHVPFTPYLAPAGVFAIGLILVLRDWIQQVTSLRFTLALVPIGGGLSYAIGVLAGYGALQKIALASLAAFIVSESVEAAVFTPIRKRSLALGVALSGTVGNVIDSALFLWIAFGSEAFFAGNFAGKLEMIAVGTVLTSLRRVYLPAGSPA